MTTTSKATPKTIEVDGEIRLETGDFNVTEQPILIEQATELFQKKVADVHGDKKLSNIALTRTSHHIGTAVTYYFTGTIEE